MLVLRCLQLLVAMELLQPLSWSFLYVKPHKVSDTKFVQELPT
jgi:hypothetical protein